MQWRNKVKHATLNDTCTKIKLQGQKLKQPTDLKTEIRVTPKFEEQ